MLKAQASLPNVDLHPAPWDLIGQGWLVALRLPARSPARNAFIAPGSVGKFGGPFSLLVFADYAQSACGPYHELLFIPGLGDFGVGRRCATISRILVSTWSSVVNGRRNWGIPKDRADFCVEYGAHRGNEDRIVVETDGRRVCELRFATIPMLPSLPVHSAVLPRSLRTLAQRDATSTYFFAPSAQGWCRPGRLVNWSFDGELFPDLAGARVVTALKVSSFRMQFPVAELRPRDAQPV